MSCVEDARFVAVTTTSSISVAAEAPVVARTEIIAADSFFLSNIIPPRWIRNYLCL